MQIKTNHVFVSYSRGDAALVTQLIADLQAYGILIWIDKQGLKPGTPDWEQALRDAIGAASAVLLVASPGSRRSRYVRDELAIAEMNNVPVYPVWIDGDKWMDSIPLGLGKVQFIDARAAQYEQGKQQIIDLLNHNSVEPPMSALNADPIPTTALPLFNPYKGLTAFSTEDTRLFFGREAFVQQLVETLVEQRNRREPNFLAVIGASGSGKSSVMMAGLIPELKHGKIPGSDEWVYLKPLLPGMHPVESLAEVLVHELPNVSLSTLDEDLSNVNMRGLLRLANRIAGKDRYVVLYVDQFEEVFTQVKDEQERVQFINLLTTAATESDSRLIVLVSMRADFYDRPLNYPELGGLLDKYSVCLLPMSLAELNDAIQKPARLAGLKFDDGLVSDIVFDVHDQAGHLPLLQFTLAKLYELRHDRRLSREEYVAIGGVRGALAKHAQSVYERLPSEEHKKIAQSLLLRLIELGSSEQDVTRRRAPLSELELMDSVANRRLALVADEFVNARLLVTNRVGSIETIEVAHEALIREWGTLNNWLRLGREDMRMHRRLTAALSEWRSSDCHPSFLATGVLLDQFNEWSRTTSMALTADETRFLLESCTQRDVQLEAERQRRLREQEIANRAQTYKRASIAFALVSVLAVALILMAFAVAASAQQEAENANAAVLAAGQTLTPVMSTLVGVEHQIDDRRRLNESIRLASASNNTEDVQLALHLAIQGMNISYSREADTALLDAIRRAEAEGPPAEFGVPVQIPYRIIAEHSDQVYAVAMSPDERLLATTGNDRLIRIWDLGTGQVLRILEGHTNSVTDLHFSRDGKTLVSAGDTTIWLWDVATGASVNVFEGHTGWVYEARFSPDEQWIVSASADLTVRLWDIASGEAVRVLEGHTQYVHSAVFSSDGAEILSASADGTVRRWDAATGVEQEVLRFPFSVLQAVYSPDGQRIAVAGRDPAVHIIQLETSREVITLRGHTFDIYKVMFSPDGTKIITGSQDTTARLWDSRTGLELRTYTGHADDVNAVAFSPGGRYIITGSWDNTVRVWDVDYRDSMFYACALVQRDLSAEERSAYTLSETLRTGQF